MKYPFSVYQTQVGDHVFWVAECPSLKGCVGQGDTPEAAIGELSGNEKEWLETAEKYGIPIPPVPAEPLNSYSGKFTVRVSPAVHQEAVEYAKKQNVSLNQHVNDAIVAYNSRLSSAVYKNAIKGLQEAVEYENGSNKFKKVR
jgi:predicted HicB family RNase H-like nuclease